jgi:hypothetical protein
MLENPVPQEMPLSKSKMPPLFKKPLPQSFEPDANNISPTKRSMPPPSKQTIPNAKAKSSAAPVEIRQVQQEKLQ